MGSQRGSKIRCRYVNVHPSFVRNSLNAYDNKMFSVCNSLGHAGFSQLYPFLQVIRCTPNFDIQHEVSVKSKHLLPISKNKGSVRVSCVFRVWVNTAFIFTLVKEFGGHFMTLLSVFFNWSVFEVMKKRKRTLRDAYYNRCASNYLQSWT